MNRRILTQESKPLAFVPEDQWARVFDRRVGWVVGREWGEFPTTKLNPGARSENELYFDIEQCERNFYQKKKSTLINFKKALYVKFCLFLLFFLLETEKYCDLYLTPWTDDKDPSYL